MRRTTLTLLALGTSAALLATAMTANGAVETSPSNGYTVTYTPDDGMVPLTAAEFPQLQAQRLATALSNNNAVTPGNPAGLHNGYAAQGFDAPDFAGSPRQILALDCTTIGGCDSGNAPADRINMPVANYRSSAEDCLRLVVGHELFHHIQYESIGFGNWSTWGADPVEGTARVMQDKLYSDLDNNAGCITYLAQVNNYLGDPSRTMWGLSYTTALFWNYLMERLGNDRAEPGVGTDFIREFWQNAQDAGSNRDFLGTLRTTIHDFDSTASLEGLFHDFTVANYTKQMDVSALPDGSKYRYVDEQQPGAAAYDAVPVTDVGTIPPSVGPTPLNVRAWAAKYLQADIGDCTGVAGLVVDGDRAGVALTSQDSGGAVVRLDKSVGTHFARAILVRTRATEGKRITRLGAVVTGLNDAADVDYRFACGAYDLQIKDPTTANKAFVGTKSDPNRFIVRVQVHGPAELGTPSVEGLRASDFTARVGNQDASVLNGAYVQGEYWLTVQAPSFPAAAPDVQDLTVRLGDVSDSNAQSVSYQVRHLDQMLTIDRSGSMLEPAAAPKIDAARNAASMYVDAARSDDKLGVVSFSGNNVEPDDDATLDALLSTMTSGNRDNARIKVLGLTANGMTSIGDGVFKSAAEFPIRGTTIGEDHIVLLSDGMENEGKYWTDVRAAVIAAGVKVDTIALGPLTDQALLQQIADDTGGTYYYVDVNSGLGGSQPLRRSTRSLKSGTSPLGAIGGSSLANNLADVYFSATEDSAGLERFWQDGDTLPGGGSTVPEIKLDEGGMTDAVIAVNWPGVSDPLKVELEAPDGTLVSPGAGVEVTRTDTHVVFRIATMDTGTWRLHLDNPDKSTGWVAMAAGRPTYSTSMWTSVADTHVFRKELDGHRWGEQIPIVASLTDKDGGVARGRVYADVTHPDGTTLRLPLLDDGNHADGTAGDGIYAGVYTRTTEFAKRGADDDSAKPDGSYQVQISAEGKNNLGEPYTRYEHRSFALYENGDPNPDTDGDGMPDRYEGYHPGCLKATDAGDAGLDPDGDGLRSLREWQAGTDPCHPDTDRGGEPDGSELKRGANPFDPSDDALPRPEGAAVIGAVIDHLPRPKLTSGTLLIRYPANPAYKSIRLLRSTSAAGPYAVAQTFDSTAKGGRVRDTGLVNSKRYYYKVVGVDFAGNRSDESPVFSGIPRKEPMPPIGSVTINADRPFVSSAATKLTLKVDDADVVSMMVSNDVDFTGAAWQPLAATLPWTLSPRADGFSTVYAKFRDRAGNVSNVVTDEVRVRAGLISLTGVIKPDKAPRDGTPDGVWLRVLGHPELPLVRTSTTGRFTLSGLPAGVTYHVSGRGAGYVVKKAVAMVPNAVTSVPATCSSTC
ncbi:choice-of-anchor X domain-containing protein [Nocardioides sp. URHA0020]|uniref:choice-of-anchor X domain-containing protein n=1 Tax=Nocardioides sp. URHA0020 TaxID=1380392 RepID=UPI00048E8A1F|nr:choice-of-anchor X domain-containing protein [Nocardioides sp. URHA0020]